MTDPTTDVAHVWNNVVNGLADHGVPARDRAYLRMTQLQGVLGTTALLAVPYQHTKDTLETSLRDQVVDALAAELGHPVSIAVSVDESLQGDRDPQPTQDEPAAEEPAAAEPEPASAAPRADVAPPIDDNARLNPRYTFESFVMGASNRFAKAAAAAVAESPARAYNPLFIYGESGLGKTHLLHAIGNAARGMYEGIRVRYVNSEEFTNDFINSIRDDKASAFQARYRNVDILLIDDIQFLQGKEQTQEEFFHTFNTLHNSEKQVVITSDQAPNGLNGFAERMRSRFEWGLRVDVQPPDLETRIAILRKKAVNERKAYADDVLEFIARRVDTNIRELEGALIRVGALSSLHSREVDIELATQALKDLSPGQGHSVTPSLIMQETSSYFDVSVDELCGQSRSRNLVNARQIAMYLCRELTELSLPNIGRHFGGRDHTTVMHAEKKIARLMAERQSLYDQVSELTTRIRRASTA